MVRVKFIYIACWHIVTVFHLLLITLKLKVDDLDESDFEDMENDDDIVEDKNVTEVDTGDLDFKDDIVDDEKSDEEKKSDTDHNIEENKNELNEQCEHKALVSDGNVISVSL